MEKTIDVLAEFIGRAVEISKNTGRETHFMVFYTLDRRAVFTPVRVGRAEELTLDMGREMRLMEKKVGLRFGGWAIDFHTHASAK